MLWEHRQKEDVLHQRRMQASVFQGRLLPGTFHKLQKASKEGRFRKEADAEKANLQVLIDENTRMLQQLEDDIEKYILEHTKYDYKTLDFFKSVHIEEK